MKRIFLSFLPFLLFFTSSFNNHFEGKRVNSVDTIGYPITQFIGSDSALVKSRGGLMGRFAPIPFTDTTSANLSRISQYPGALIYTSSLDKYWYRNSTAKAWIEFTSSGGATVNIYNSNGILTSDRNLDGAGLSLGFHTLSKLWTQSDTLDIELRGNKIFTIAGLDETQDTTTYKPVVIDPLTGRVLQSSYWFGGSGGGGGTTGIRFDSSYTPLGGSRGVDSFVVKSIRIRRNNVTVVPTEFGDSAAYWNIDVPDTTSLSNRINEKLDKIGSADSVSITVINPVFRLIGLSEGGSSSDSVLVIGDDGMIKKRDIAAFTPNLQEVLAVDGNSPHIQGATLYMDTTAFNVIDAAYISIGTFLNETSFSGIELTTDASTIQHYKDGKTASITLNDTILLNTNEGWLKIDSLNSGTSTDSVLVWDQSTGNVKKRNASAFGGGGSGVTTIGTINGTTKSANGGVISGSTLYFQTFDATNPGLVPTGGTSSTFLRGDGTWQTISGTGTVTSVATNTGTGITGGTITTTGTIAADTTLLSTRLWRQKGIDSVQGNITSGLALKLNITDTSNKWITSVYRKTASDSVFYVKGGTATFAYKDSIGSGSGGLTKGTTTISNSATTRILYDSSGILQNNANLTYNSGGELLVATTTDNGAYNLQVGGSILTTGSIKLYGASSGFIVNNRTAPTNDAFQIYSPDGTLRFYSTADRFVLTAAGKLGLTNITSPTAYLHLPAGSTTAATAPLKFSTGSPTTTPEIGAMQFSNGLWIIDSSNSVRDTIATRSWVRNNVSGGSGTVTSVGAGYGISGGTITTTGTHSLDTATVSGFYLRRKDSLTASNPLGYVTKKVLADSLAARSYLSAGEGINLTTVVDTTTISIKYDTTALASFGAGAGLAGDTAAFSTSSIYGSFYNSGSDTLIITRLQIGLQGTSPSITATVYYNDSLNVTAGATKLVNAGSAATNIYTGTSVTSFDNTKIPPGVWVWVGTPTVTTKPTYFSLSLIGYKKRVTP